MITDKELKEIKSYLEKSENPLFFYDDDPDGLCSFLILKRFLNKGKGVCIKAGTLDLKFNRKIEEYSPDLVVILDAPIVSQEFVNKINVPIIWLDHHPLSKTKGTHYYNPLKSDIKDNRPTTFWCYQITEQDLWLAVIGCISDCYFPKFAKDFSKQYPDLLPKDIKKPFDALFETKLGELIKIFRFLLKGRVSEVRKSVGILSNIKNPKEILDKTTSKGKYLFKKIQKVKSEYDYLIKQAISEATKDELLIFHAPSNKFAMTGDLSDELMHRFQDKFIIVVREKSGLMKFSMRGWKYDVRKIFKEATKGINAFGGGHVHACGGEVPREFWEEFTFKVRKLMKNYKLN